MSLTGPSDEACPESPCLDPMLPAYQNSRAERSRPPRPFQHQRRPHDVMGMTSQNELLIRDVRMMHRDVRLEDFAGQTVILDGVFRRVASLDAEPTLTVPLEMRPILRLSHPVNRARTVVVAPADLPRVRFLSEDGEHAPGRIKHGIMRLHCLLARKQTRVRLRPGQQFEARLLHRELQGPFLVRVASEGRLLATNQTGKATHRRSFTIRPADIVPRYRTVFSLDFRADFDVDSFLFHEDRLRASSGVSLRGLSLSGAIRDGFFQDPILGILPDGGRRANVPKLTNGADHLRVFDHYIRKHTPPPAGAVTALPRSLTILNLSVSNQGDAACVLDALIEFRRQNPAASMYIVASKLGPAEFQKSPEFRHYLSTLAENNIQVNDYTSGANRQTRQVMHGKAIIIDNHVLFSTGAVMDTWPINKADFALELPRAAAKAFARYVDRTILHNGAVTLGCRVELTAELAGLGIMINDPVVGLTYNSRAQDALIRGARDELLISVSELVDPDVTRLIIRRAIDGVRVTVQVRELDASSARLLAMFTLVLPTLRVEDSSWWEPRPHWNSIVADGVAAYLGTSYLWPTQRSMIHQGRSFENGVLLHGEAARRVSCQVDSLRARNVGIREKEMARLIKAVPAQKDENMFCSFFELYNTQGVAC